MDKALIPLFECLQIVRNNHRNSFQTLLEAEKEFKTVSLELSAQLTGKPPKALSVGYGKCSESPSERHVFHYDSDNCIHCNQSEKHEDT